jgi:hypothetical protein
MHTVNKKGVEYNKKAKKDAEYKHKIEEQEFLRDYDTNVKPLYLEAKCLFASLMKQRKIHNYEINDLKAIIDNRLGRYVDHYHNYKFKNDAHEIYVKMKNFHLYEYDWEVILNFLHSMENNEPIKREKKPKEKKTKDKEIKEELV